MGYREVSQLKVGSRLNKLEKENKELKLQLEVSEKSNCEKLKKLEDKIQELEFKNRNTVGYVKSNSKIINQNFSEMDKANKTTSENFKYIEQFQESTIKKFKELHYTISFIMIAIAIVCVIQIAQNAL